MSNKKRQSSTSDGRGDAKLQATKRNKGDAATSSGTLSLDVVMKPTSTSSSRTEQEVVLQQEEAAAEKQKKDLAVKARYLSADIGSLLEDVSFLDWLFHETVRIRKRCIVDQEKYDQRQQTLNEKLERASKKQLRRFQKDLEIEHGAQIAKQRFDEQRAELEHTLDPKSRGNAVQWLTEEEFKEWTQKRPELQTDDHDVLDRFLSVLSIFSLQPNRATTPFWFRLLASADSELPFRDLLDKAHRKRLFEFRWWADFSWVRGGAARNVPEKYYFSGSWSGLYLDVDHEEQQQPMKAITENGAAAIKNAGGGDLVQQRVGIILPSWEAPERMSRDNAIPDLGKRVFREYSNLLLQMVGSDIKAAKPILSSLVAALSWSNQQDRVGQRIFILGQEFADGKALKEECRNLMKEYATSGEYLLEDDYLFMRELFSFHPQFSGGDPMPRVSSRKDLPLHNSKGHTTSLAAGASTSVAGELSKTTSSSSSSSTSTSRGNIGTTPAAKGRLVHQQQKEHNPQQQLIRTRSKVYCPGFYASRKHVTDINFFTKIGVCQHSLYNRQRVYFLANDDTPDDIIDPATGRLRNTTTSSSTTTRQGMDDSSTPTYISVAEKGDAASANKSKKDSNISKSIEDHPVEHQELEISYTRSVDNVPTSDSETRRFIEALLVKILVQRPEPDVLEQMANALDERFPKRWEEAMAFRLYTGSMMNLCLALPALAPRVFRATLRGLVDVDAWIVEKAEDGEDVAPAAAVVSGQVVPTGVVPSTVGPVDNRAVALADACAANKTSEAADDGGKSVASTAPTETADNKRDETSEENVNKVSQKLDCAMVVVFEFLAKFFDLTSHHPKLTSEVKCRSASMALADAARGGSDVSTASRVRSATTSASSTSTATTTTTSANQINKFSLAALKEDHSLPEHKVAFLESLLQEFQDNFLQQQAKLENCNGILDTLYGGDTTALTPNGDKCSKNVQYIYFYLCCLHPRFCEEFLCRLLQTFYGQPTSSNYKKRSASTNSVVLPAAVSIEENNNNGRNTTTNNDVDARRAASTGATGASTISTPRRSPASFSIGVPFTHRKAAVQYLASILVRAKFLSTQYAVKAIGYIVEWCVSMLPVIEKRLLPNRKTDAKDLNASSSSSAAIRDNTFCEVKDPESELFHHAVQSICYILCFKVQKLLQEKDASLYAPTGANKRRMSTARNRSSCGSNYGKQEVQLGEQGSSSKPTNKNSNVLEEIFFSVTEPNLSSILLSPLRPLRRLEHHTCDEFERRMRNNLGDRLDHIWSHSFGTTTTSTTTNTDKNEEAATSSSSFPERDPYHIYRISQCLFPFEEYRLRNSKCMIARLWTDYSETKPEWENEMEHEREMAASGMQPGGEDEGDHSDGCGGSASGGSGQQHLLNAPNTSIVNIKMEFDEDVTHESLDLQLQQQQRLRSSLKKGPRRGFESAEEDENAAKKKRRRVHFAPNLEESISIPNNEMLKEQKDALKKGKNGDNSSERKNDQMKALEKAAGNGDNIKNSEVDSGGSDDEDNAEDDRYADPEESREDSFLPSSAFSPDLSAFGSVMDRLSAGGAARDEGEGAGNYLYHITSSASTQGREDEDEVVVVGTAGEDEHEAFPEMIEDHDVHNNLHQVSSDEEMSDE